MLHSDNTLDSDDDSDPNEDNNYEDSDTSNESNDPEQKKFERSAFSRILDRLMMLDIEDIDLDTKLERNARKAMNIVSRKFFINAMEEEREIEMEKMLSFMYQMAGLNSEQYTDFEQRFTDFKQQISNTATSTANLDVHATLPNNYIDDNSKTLISDLIEIIKKNDINEVRTFITDMKKDSKICLSETLVNIIPFLCEYNQHEILEYVMQELLNPIEIARKNMAFIHALKMNDTDLIEKLYLYYSGNLHWLGNEATDVKLYELKLTWNLKLLNILLCNARTSLSDAKVTNETMYYLDSLINFNSFQLLLYTNLAIYRTSCINKSQDFDNMETQIKAIKDIILTIFKIYKFHMTKHEIKEVHCQVPDWMRNVLRDDYQMDFNCIDTVTREFFFKKMDLNITLILLDNLNLLEERLRLPGGLYKKVNTRLYHFMYHLNKDWSAFMPKESVESLKIPFHIGGGPYENVVFNLDLKKLIISPLIYLERKEFYNCLNNLKDELENIDIKSHIRDKSKKTSDETQNLDILPYINDEVSLEKMLSYMDGLPDVDLEKERENGQLIIMRIIQILGEFIKDSEESSHLSSETKGFLQTEVPSSTMKLLIKIRNNITHVKDAQLLAKIEVEQNHKNKKIFNDVLIELKDIKNRVLEFLESHKLRAKKASIKDALKLLQQRFDEISMFNNESQVNVEEKEENGYFKQIWRIDGSSKQCKRDVTFLEKNREFLIHNLIETTKHLKERMLSKLPRYIQNIKTTLKYISESSDQHKGENIDDLNEQWHVVKEILRFIVEDANIFEDHPWELKRSRCSSQFKHILTLSPTKDNVKSVNYFIEMIIDSAKMIDDNFDIKTIDTQIFRDSELTHSGLDKLNELLNRSNFLTIREQKSIISNVSMIMEWCKKLNDIVNQNEPMSSKDSDTLQKNLRLNSHSETHLLNLVLGKKRSLNLVECLSNRVSLLKSVLNAHCSYDKKQHLILLKNQKFRLIVEALLFDIMNIFNDTNLKDSLKKTSKFLAGVNLRNMLSHGNPLLELAGDVIDDKDLPMEFMAKALRYARDEGAIKALNTLLRQKVHPKDIEQEVNNLKKDQQELVKEFKKSQHWKEYLVLAFKDENSRTKSNDQPKSNKTNGKEHSEGSEQTTRIGKSAKSNLKCKNIEETNENELLKAVKAGKLEEVEKLVNTAANVNAVDASEKACLHYAAMKGRVDMIAVLLKRGVDVRCARDGRSALHYAAMNGHGNAARALLDAAADVTAVDHVGKTPLHYAAMNGHGNAARALLDAAADVTAVDHVGKTPLHYAVMRERTEVARALLAAGADVAALDRDGKTPLDYAILEPLKDLTLNFHNNS